MYLGLPLSSHKLKIEDFLALITKAERYLSRWRAQLLSFGGRLRRAKCCSRRPTSICHGSYGASTVSGPSALSVTPSCGPRPIRPRGQGVSLQTRRMAWCLVYPSVEQLSASEDVAPSAHPARLPLGLLVWTCLDGHMLSPSTLAASGLSNPHWFSLVRLMPLYRGISMATMGDEARTADCLLSRLLAVGRPSGGGHAVALLTLHFPRRHRFVRECA